MDCLYTALGLCVVFIIIQVIWEFKKTWCFIFHQKHRQPTGKGRMDVFLGIMATPIAFYKCLKCGNEFEKEAGKSDVW